MKPEDIADQAIAARQHKAKTYMAGMTPTGLALCIDKADLHYLWDTKGRMFVDLTSGGGALPMGAYHAINSAIWANPFSSFPHVSRYGDTCLAVQAEYAQAISERFPLVEGEPQLVWLTNSGIEAQELARMLASWVSPLRTNVKPIDALTYEPLDTGQAQKLAALAVERGGAIVVDERLTGYGRFGSFRAAERYDLDPFAPSTITILGEAGGGGVPFGAVVAPRALWDHVDRPGHPLTTTYGGNPIACSAGLAVLRAQDGMFYDHVREVAIVLEEACEGLRSQFPTMILSHQGRGMMRSLLFHPSSDMELVHQALLNNGVMADVDDRGQRVLLAPPLIMTDVAVRSAVDLIAAAMVELESVAPVS